MLKILLAAGHVLAIIALAVLAAYKDYGEFREEGFNGYKWSMFMMAPGGFAMMSLAEMLEGWHVSVLWILPLGILYFIILATAPKVFDRYFPHKPENPEE